MLILLKSWLHSFGSLRKTFQWILLNTIRMLDQTGFDTTTDKTIGKSLPDNHGPQTGTNIEHVTHHGIIGKALLIKLTAGLHFVSPLNNVMRITITESLAVISPQLCTNAVNCGFSVITDLTN